jgi:hypothetical protein
MPEDPEKIKNAGESIRNELLKMSSMPESEINKYFKNFQGLNKALDLQEKY